jgi:hypothetical protein
MTDKIGLGIDFDLDDGEALLAAFEKQLGTTRDATKSLEQSLIESAKAAADKAGRMKALKSALDEAVTGTKAQAAAEAAAAKATKDASKAQAEADADAAKAKALLATNSAKVDEIFRKGIGGGEFAEKTKDIAKGIELWGDKTLTTMQQTSALAGAVGVGIRLFANYAQAVNAAEIALRTQHEQLQLLGPAYAAMNREAQGTLTTQSALALRNELQSNGLRLNTQQLATATRAARDYSQVQGVEMSTATALVTQALNGDTAAMQRLGISAHDSTEALNLLAKQQERGAVIGRTAAEQAAIEANHIDRLKNGVIALAGQLTQLSGGLGVMHDAFTIWDADWTSLDSVNRALNASYPAVRDHAVAAAAAAARGAHDAAEGAEKVRTGSSQVETQFKANTTAVQAYVHQLEELRKASEAAGRASTDLSSALQPGEDAAARDARQLSVITQNAGRSRADRQHMLDLRRRAVASGQRVEDFDLGAGVSGGQDNSDLQRQLVAQQNLARIEQGFSVHLVEIHRQRHESVQHFLQARIDAQTAANQEFHRLHQQEIADAYELQEREYANAAGMTTAATAEGDAAKQRMEIGLAVVRAAQAETDQRVAMRNYELQQTHSYAVQMQHVYDQLAGGTETSAQRMSGAISGTLSSMEGAFQQGLAAVIEGNETGVEALQKFTHSVLLQTATKAAVLTIEETAAGFSMVARGAAAEGADPGADTSAGAHFVSAAIYAGIAGGSAAGAYATNAPKSVGATSGAGRAPSAAASLGRTGAANDNGGPRQVNVYVNGSVIDGRILAPAVGGALDELHGSRQLPAWMRPTG